MLQTKDLIWTLFFLGIAVSLQVDIVPSQGEISVGESKFFLCQVAGDAKDKDISWFSPNGEKLTPNQQRISVVWNDDSSSTLTIYNANIDDAGIYKCVVTGEDGSESEATVNVKIFQKLMFKNAPTPQEFREGEDAVIVCDVVSSLPPTIIWKHKGRDVILKKDVRFTVLSNNYLQIRGIKKTDEGTYRCEGRILARGEINFKDIQVIVNVPPTVQARQSIVNATANLGQSVTLVCDAEGFPEPTMSWTKDGEQIENEEDEKYIFSDDSSELTIRKVDKSDEAEYICIAENKAGEQDASIHLKVFAKPKITYVENQTAMELEEQVTLTCEASGDPIPSITWRTSTRNISSEEKASWTRPEKQETLDGHMVVRGHARLSSLILKSIQYTDAGEYICTASNTIGQDSQSMYLEVQYAPKLQGPVAVYTWEGNQVNITCEVFAHPSATISWFRDGQLLPSSNYSNIKIYNSPSASYLEVTPDSENDFGNYNCTAVNRIGQESLEFILVQADTPSSPSIDQVDPYSSTAQVHFDEPEATGGVPILKYKAEWRAMGEEAWHFKWYEAKEASLEGIVTIMGLKPETTYAVRLAALNGKGLGEISTASEFKTQPVREPSAPKLEGQMGEDGNSIKVNLIKQDDGGSPIRHYLVKYRALSSEWKPEIRLPSGSDHVMLKSLDWNAEYEVYVVAENQQGKSKAAHFVFRTSAQPTAIPANGSPTSGLSTGAIVGILIVIFVLLLVVVDITCYFLNKCGLLMCIAVNLCGKAGPGAKGKDMEEGKAAFSKDESKEPIVEVRTEEERTPNHDGGKHTEPNETTPLTEPELPADTSATVEDMLPSVTTITTNSDTITETFATAQNSPTSETTTLTSSIAPQVTAMPDSNSVPAGQATPSKGPGVSAASPPPASAPKVAPLVDLSDTPTSAPASNNLSSSVLANQGAVLSPSAPPGVGEASKAPATSKPAPSPAPAPAGAASPPAAAAVSATEAPQAKQEAPSTKGPDPEPTQPGAAKSPAAEAATALASPKSEAAPVGTTNPSQGEDFKMDEGNFKTPDIDLAKDVFAALSSPAPAAGASGQAPELAPSTADSSVSPAPAKTEKGPVEAKSECQETETKPVPAEVKTVPNDATQTKENESKA
ncbi:neural cell adhesion molecule 1 isoform X8 [Choloepus didactylus]|uniref:neural cell adhesion molecule 1 isoform X8 n=1 Tax=Choloepus didactylus TaxID=27675 RepID=UPI00189E9C81|nr:neural cell adhesion molecule 1 isoform X8 [Choloepus didactylus]